MKVTHGAQFQTSLTGFEKVGYHGTTSLASTAIEAHGFLPNKVFADHEHSVILQMAEELGWNTGSYKQWLGMRSVSFAKDPAFSINHVTAAGKSGGQGLYNVREALEAILANGSAASKAVAQTFQQKLSGIRAAPPVIYMVDLSNLEPCLVDGGGDYNIFWDPSKPLPTSSIIGPERIIEKLVLPVV